MNRLLDFIRENMSVRHAVSNFYVAGFILFALPFARPLFIALISFSLFCMFMLVCALNRDWRPMVIGWFVFVIVSAFFLEWIGVSSGVVFGRYAYGKGLAPLLHATPIVIGFKRLLLVYCSRAVVSGMPFVRRPLARIFIASVVMLVYDAVLELAAPFMSMWNFDSCYPPLRNFIAWFVAAVFYHSGMEILHVDTDPKAAVIIVAQWIFLLAIALFSMITIL